MVVDMFKYDWLSKGIAVLIIALTIVVILLVGYGIFYAADSWGVTSSSYRAIAVDRHYTAAWIETNVITVGKVMVPQIIHHPESWSITARYDNELISCPASEEQYNQFTYDKQIDVELKRGRISSKTYCRGINQI